MVSGTRSLVERAIVRSEEEGTAKEGKKTKIIGEFAFVQRREDNCAFPERRLVRPLGLLNSATPNGHVYLEPCTPVLRNPFPQLAPHVFCNGHNSTTT